MWDSSYGDGLEEDEPRGTLTERQRERMRRILRVVIDELRTSDVEYLTMELIAQRSRVGLGTIYRYFGSREKLLAHATDEWLTGIARRVRSQNVTGTARERVLASMRDGAAQLYTEPGLLKAWTQAHTSQPANTRGLFQQINAYTFGADAIDLSEDLSLVMDGVWMSGVLAWSVGQRPWTQVTRDLERAVNLVFDAHG